MIGRYGDLSVYREVFNSADFYRIMAGGLLIPAGYLFVRVDFLTEALSGLLPDEKILLDIFLFLSIALNGLPIVLDAVKGLLQRKVNVDELVSIAIIACLINGNYLEAALISFIMVLGAFIEEAVSDRARGAIETLVNANPQTALIEKNGHTQTKPIRAVETGEIAVVRAGDTIPVDGRITEGSGAIDESLLTGEAFPVFKGPGDELSAGTVNTDGFIKLAVSRTGSDATIGRIIDLIQNAENSKIKSTRIVDQYAGYFTPIILTIAALTFFFTRDMARTITVLVVGCPCSFLLAGPVATVATVGRAARSGIMIKGGRYLEKFALTRSFFFDKTGTLTAGKPVITNIRPAGGFTREKVLAMAAAVEQGSTHPIADAIIKKASQMGLEKKKAIDLAVAPGFGVNAVIDGSVVSVGAGKTGSATGETIVQVKIDGDDAGEIAMLDRVRPDVAEAVNQLKELGVTRMSILSGDSKNAVKRIADEIGIADCHYRLTPEAKMEIIGKTHCFDAVFVGDGMNDAPSLKAAAVGVAMGLRGSDMALSTADIVLMKDRISLLPFLIRLSRKMTRTIKINVIISLGINLVAIGLGMAGLLSPIMGAIAHNVGSILVVMMSSAIAFTRETTLNAQSHPAFNTIETEQHG